MTTAQDQVVALRLSARDVERIYSMVIGEQSLLSITTAIEGQHPELTTPFTTDCISHIKYQCGYRDGFEDGRDDERDRVFDEVEDARREGYDDGFEDAKAKFSEPGGAA